jgi:hypothetical protein
MPLLVAGHKSEDGVSGMVRPLVDGVGVNL